MKINFIITLAICVILLLFSSCKKEEKSLPFLGQKQVVDGIEVNHKVRSWTFTNQDSISISDELLKGHIYLVDYFFISCPSICPKVKQQMLRIQDKYKSEELIKLVSISMDPKRDTVPALKKYANKLGAIDDKWHFLTGDKDLIYTLNNDFFIAALEDDTAPGGFDHSGKIIAVDPNGHVRAFAEGTDPEDVTELLNELDMLIKEVKQSNG